MKRFFTVAALSALLVLPSFGQGFWESLEADAGIGVQVPLGALADVSVVGLGVSGRASVEVLADYGVRAFADIGGIGQVMQTATDGIISCMVGGGLLWRPSGLPLDMGLGLGYGIMPHLAWGGAISSPVQLFMDQYLNLTVDISVPLGTGAIVVRPGYIVFPEQESVLGHMIGIVVGYRF